MGEAQGKEFGAATAFKYTRGCCPAPTYPASYAPQENIKQLAELTRLVRGELSGLHRRILAALITIDVHARDIVSDLVQRGTKVGSFPPS